MVEGGATSVHDRINYAYQEWVAPVDGMIGEKQWYGEAVLTFHERFLKRFAEASQQQQAYAQILTMTALVHHDAVTVAHRRLLDIADVTIEQLNGGTAASKQYSQVEDAVTIAGGGAPQISSRRYADIYKAGYVNLPGAAGQYAEAQAKLASCVPAAAAYTYFGRSVPLFVQARDLLAGISAASASR